MVFEMRLADEPTALEQLADCTFVAHLFRASAYETGADDESEKDAAPAEDDGEQDAA